MRKVKKIGREWGPRRTLGPWADSGAAAYIGAVGGHRGRGRAVGPRADTGAAADIGAAANIGAAADIGAAGGIMRGIKMDSGARDGREVAWRWRWESGRWKRGAVPQGVKLGVRGRESVGFGRTSAPWRRIWGL